MKLYRRIEQYEPVNEQEKRDKTVMLQYLKESEDALCRSNQIAHFSASSWILNKEHNKVLMIYHNIYNSWAWTGGHADGEEDLLQVAIREAQEETGLAKLAPQSEIFSLEILTVNGHIKKGQYVSSHLHLNVTYLLEADDRLKLRIKEDENSGVVWFTMEQAVEACSEPWMKEIYKKLNTKAKNL